jgi:membrane fusion protein (multidrug efflux system)
MEGDVVQPGQSILTINSDDALWITANIEETNLSQVRIGDAVTFSVDAYQGKEFKGKIQEIGSSTAAQFSLIPANYASGNFTKITQRVPVKISIEPSSNFDLKSFLPGMSVIVKIKKKG